MLYNFTFVCFVEVDRAFLPHREIGCSILTLPAQRFVIMDNYNMQLIIWITTFNAESSITRSCYLRLTLCGYRETPYRNHFMKSCNPVSIKPNDYNQSKFMNYNLKDATKKVCPRDSLV